jgi:hypothetical protein
MSMVDFGRVATINTQKEEIGELKFQNRRLRFGLEQAKRDILRLVPGGPERDAAIASIAREFALCQ